MKSMASMSLDSGSLDDLTAGPISALVGWGNETTSLASLYFQKGATLGGGGALGPDGPYGRARRRMITRRRRHTGTRRRQGLHGRVVYHPSDHLTHSAKVDAVRREPSHSASSALNEATLRPLIDIAFWSPFKEVRQDAADAFASLSEHPDTFSDDVPMAMALGALLQLIVVGNPSNSTRIISQAACALANLSAVQAVRERLLQSPEGVTACLQLLRMNTPAVTLHAVRVLNNIADLPEAPATIVDAGAMRTLMSVINSRDQRVQRTALRVAVKLSTSVLQPTRVGDSTTLFRILELFENAKNPEIRVGLLDLLVQLANNSDVRARLVAAGVLKTMAKLLLPATSPPVLCQVLVCLQRLSLSKDVQPHVIESPVVALLLTTIFGERVGSEDPIPKETRGGRLSVIQSRASAAGSDGTGSVLGPLPQGQDRSASPSMPAPTSHFKHILTRAGAVMGGSTTSMGHDLIEEADLASDQMGARPTSRASRHSRVSGARSRSPARSRRSASPGSSRPRSARRPGSAPRSRPTSATVRPWSRQSATGRRSRPTSARASSRGGASSRQSGDTADDGGAERRVSFFRNHPLHRTPGGVDAAVPRDAVPAHLEALAEAQAAQARKMQSFYGRLPDLASTASMLASVARFKLRATGAAEAAAASDVAAAVRAGSKPLLPVPAAGDDDVKSEDDIAGDNNETSLTPPPGGAMLAVYVDDDADRARRRAKRFERLKTPPVPAKGVLAAKPSKAVSMRVALGKGGAGPPQVRRHGSSPPGRSGHASKSPRAAGKSSRTRAAETTTGGVAVSPMRAGRGAAAPASQPRRPSRRPRPGAAHSARGRVRGVAGPTKPPASGRRGHGPAGGAWRGRVHFRTHTGKGGAKRGGHGGRDKGKKARGGPGENMGVSLKHVVGTAARLRRAGEVARLVRILVAQGQAAARIAAITADDGGGLDASGAAAATSPRGAEPSFLDDTSLASPPVMVQCMRFLNTAKTFMTPPQLKAVRVAVTMLSQLCGCRPLRDHLVCQTSLLPCLFQPRIIISFDRRIRRAVVACVEALSQRDGNCTWRHQLMYRYGVVQALQVLLAGTDTRAQEAAVRVVSLLVETVSLQMVLCVHAILEPLLALAGMSDHAVQCAIAKTVRIMAGDATRHPVLIECGAASAMLLLLRPNAEDAHQDAVQALHSLSSSEDACLAMVSSGRLGYCIRLSRRGHGVIRKLATELLENANEHLAAKRIQDMARRHFACSGKDFASFKADDAAAAATAGTQRRRTARGQDHVSSSSSSSDSDADHEEHVRAVTEHDVWDDQ